MARFIITSGSGDVHQRARTTVADQALDLRLRALLAPDEKVVMQHCIAQR